MNRCATSNHAPVGTGFGRTLTSALSQTLGLLLALALVSAPALADIQPRQFPSQTRRATLLVTAPPDVLIDGTAARLAPAARIHDPQNMMAMSASLVGQQLLVNFTLEPGGLIHEVWILTPQEAAMPMPYAHAPRNFQFASEINTTPQDDGHTPFNRLPRFPQAR